MKRKTLILLAKLAVSLAIIGYLLRSVFTDPKSAVTLARLRNEPKDWWLLSAAMACFFLTALLTIIRWYFLVRAVGLPFRFRDALRLGFLGYTVSQISLGAVGGDMFKAVFLAHEHIGRRTEAVSTIILDRLLGLYGLFLIGSIVVVGGQIDRSDPKIAFLCTLTISGTGLMTLIFALVMLPERTFGSLPVLLTRIPKIGNVAGKLWRAAGMYRTHHGVVWGMLGLTFIVHIVNVLGYYCIAKGLPEPAPGLAKHFLIIPLGILAGAIPLPFAALGAFEVILNVLYAAVGATHKLGLLVALCSRIISLLVALIGVGFYLGGRQEVKEVLHEAKEIEGEEVSEVKIRRR